MAILAKGGKTYARLRFNVGPGASVLIPIQVDYSQEFEGSDWGAWQQEYECHVHPMELPLDVMGGDAREARLDRRQQDRHVNQELLEVLGEDPRDTHRWWEEWDEVRF